jgi:hypothetical protein
MWWCGLATQNQLATMSQHRKVAPHGRAEVIASSYTTDLVLFMASISLPLTQRPAILCHYLLPVYATNLCMTTSEISTMVAMYYMCQVLSCYTTSLRVEVHLFLNAFSVVILVLAWVSINQTWSVYLIAIGAGLGKAEYLGQVLINAVDAPAAKKRKACSSNPAARCTGAIVGYVLGGQVYCSDPSYNLLLGVGIVLSSMTLAQELVLIRMITPGFGCFHDEEAASRQALLIQ